MTMGWFDGKHLLLIAVTVAVLLQEGSAHRRWRCNWYRCSSFVNHFQNRCAGHGRYSSFQGHSHRQIATKLEMYHMPRGDSSVEACKAECSNSPICTGFEYVLTPSHPGSLAVKLNYTQSIATGSFQFAVYGGRYPGENDNMYIGHDCIKRCVGICSRQIVTRWDNPLFIRDDPLCTFYRKDDCEIPQQYSWILHRCMPCMPHLSTTTTTTTVAPNNEGCPGDDFLNTEVMSITGLPDSDIISGATDLEACKTACLNMGFDECPGFFFSGATCFRWNQTPNQADVSVDCDPSGTGALYLRLDPTTCVLPDIVTPTTSGEWGVFADTSLPSGFAFPGLPTVVTPLCCTLACNYKPDCCAVDFNTNFGFCVEHNVTVNSIPFSCQAIQTNTGDTVHFAKPLGTNACAARYDENPSCSAIKPPA